MNCSDPAMQNDYYYRQKSKINLFTVCLLLIYLVSGCATLGPTPLEQHQKYALPIDELEGASNSGINAASVPVRKLYPGDLLKILFYRSPLTVKDFFLRPGDRIELRFAESSDLNLNQPILPDGSISLPFVSEMITAAGKTPAELNSQIRALYKPILRNPEVTVVVTEFGVAVDKFQLDMQNEIGGKSRSVTIGEFGQAQFPLLGELYVGDKTIDNLRSTLQNHYIEIFPDLRVDVALEKAANRGVFIIGEVHSPGYHSISQPVSILEALALAGGHTRQARLDSSVVIHKTSEALVGKRVDVEALLSFEPEASMVSLSGNDVLFIPRTKLPQVAEITRHIGEILFFRGWDIGIGFQSNELNF